MHGGACATGASKLLDRASPDVSRNHGLSCPPRRGLVDPRPAMKSLAVACLVACTPSPHAPVANPCAQVVLPIDGNRIWVDREGTGPLTVAFEAGFGNDSTVWSAIAPRIRAA